MVKVPQGAPRKRYFTARDELRQELGREPTWQELAERANLTLDRVAEFENAYSLPLHIDLGWDAMEGEIGEALAHAQDEPSKALQERLDLLDEQAREVINRTVLGTSYPSDIARDFGISLADAVNIQKRALRLLKASYGDSERERNMVLEAKLRRGILSLEDYDLTDKQRKVLEDTIVRDRTHAEIAEEVGSSAAAVSQVRGLALRRIARQVAGHSPDHPSHARCPGCGEIKEWGEFRATSKHGRASLCLECEAAREPLTPPTKQPPTKEPRTPPAKKPPPVKEPRTPRAKKPPPVKEPLPSPIRCPACNRLMPPDAFEEDGERCRDCRTPKTSQCFKCNQRKNRDEFDWHHGRWGHKQSLLRCKECRK